MTSRKGKGNAKGQGRQPTVGQGGATARIDARVTPEQRAEYERRGGVKALRQWLDGDKLAAPDNNPPPADNWPSITEE